MSSSCRDHLVLHQPGAAEQGAFAEHHAEAQDARQQPVVLDAPHDQAQAEVERMAREVLTNPVIEEFRFSLAD